MYTSIDQQHYTTKASTYKLANLILLSPIGVGVEAIGGLHVYRSYTKVCSVITNRTLYVVSNKQLVAITADESKNTAIHY